MSHDVPREKRELSSNAAGARPLEDLPIELLLEQNRVLKRIAQGEPLHLVLDALLRGVEEQSPGMLASILLLDRDGVHIRHGAAPSLPESYMSSIDGQPIGPVAGSCGTAAFRGEPVVVEDIAIDPLWASYKHLALQHGLRACWSTPIFDDQRRVLGTFALYFTRPGRPSEEHRQQIEMVTSTASIAIVKHREEQALAAATQRLRLAVSAGKVGVWERDVRSNRIVWSSELKTILGYPLDSESSTFEDFLASVHPDDLGYVKSAVEQAVTQREDATLEFRVIWPDGSVHWIEMIGKTESDEQGHPTFARGVGLDVTARREMEEEIKLRDAMLVDAQRVAGFGSYEWSPKTNALRWTEELFHIFGLDSRSFQPSFEAYLERVHPDDRRETRRRVEDCVRNFTSFEGEERIVRPDGAVRWLYSRGKWIFDQNQQAEKLVGTCLDVTDRREMELARSGLEEELRQSQKIESVGRLAGGVAHDFNNLLTVIFGYATLCEAELPKEHPAAKHIQEIVHAAESAATLTRHLLAFSRRQMIQPVIVDLNSVVHNLNKMMTRVIGEHISVRMELDDALGSINADPGQMDQLLMNLLVNATDAMPKGGEILIRTFNAELGEEFVRTHPAISPGRYVALSVSDTGSGMDAQTKSKIFEPFFTTKPVGKGTGLGLSMVYGAVKQNSGQITVESEVDKGTTFTVYFPRVGNMPEKGVSPAMKAPGKGTETILLVEDDEALRNLTTSLLTPQGYKVLAARSVADAVALSQQHSNQIQLLLTDVVMPEMNGPELAAKLKAERPDLRVLFMSGYSGKLLTHQGVLKAEAAILLKPFNKQELLAQVRAVLERRN